MRRNLALTIRLTSLTDKNFERDRHGESKREKGNLRCQIEKSLEFPTTFSLDLNLSLFGTHLEISWWRNTRRAQEEKLVVYSCRCWWARDLRETKYGVGFCLGLFHWAVFQSSLAIAWWFSFLYHFANGKSHHRILVYVVLRYFITTGVFGALRNRNQLYFLAGHEKDTLSIGTGWASMHTDPAVRLWRS